MSKNGFLKKNPKIFERISRSRFRAHLVQIMKTAKSLLAVGMLVRGHHRAVVATFWCLSLITIYFAEKKKKIRNRSTDGHLGLTSKYKFETENTKYSKISLVL